MSQGTKLKLSNAQLKKLTIELKHLKCSDTELVDYSALAQLLHACLAFQTFLSRWDELGELSGDEFTTASLKFTEDYGINAEDSSVVECFDSFMEKEGITLEPISTKSAQKSPLDAPDSLGPTIITRHKLLGEEQ